jgi:hypothetical protein
MVSLPRATGVVQKSAKSGVIPVLTRNGKALPRDESGRLLCADETEPRRKGGSLDTSMVSQRAHFVLRD